METKLERIAEISANSPRPEFTSLYHLINKEMEKLLSYYVQSRFLRPKIRPYKTNNYYAILMKGGMTHDSVLEKDR